jgi:hypothetical protein
VSREERLCKKYIILVVFVHGMFKTVSLTSASPFLSLHYKGSQMYLFRFCSDKHFVPCDYISSRPIRPMRPAKLDPSIAIGTEAAPVDVLPVPEPVLVDPPAAVAVPV